MKLYNLLRVDGFMLLGESQRYFLVLGWQTFFLVPGFFLLPILHFDIFNVFFEVENAVVQLFDKIVALYAVFWPQQFDPGLQFFADLEDFTGVVRVQEEEKMVSESGFRSNVDFIGLHSLEVLQQVFSGLHAVAEDGVDVLSVLFPP